MSYWDSVGAQTFTTNLIRQLSRIADSVEELTRLAKAEQSNVSNYSDSAAASVEGSQDGDVC